MTRTHSMRSGPPTCSMAWTTTFAAELLSHKDVYVRRWAVRIIGDKGKTWEKSSAALAALAKTETNHEIRAQLAASAKRLPAKNCDANAARSARLLRQGKGRPSAAAHLVGDGKQSRESTRRRARLLRRQTKYGCTRSRAPRSRRISPSDTHSPVARRICKAARSSSRSRPTMKRADLSSQALHLRLRARRCRSCLTRSPPR